MIISLSISICKANHQKSYYYGYGRNNAENKLWKLENTSNQQKNENLTDIQKGLNEWQSKNFKDSYKHKTENDMCLFKEGLKNE